MVIKKTQREIEFVNITLQVTAIKQYAVYPYSTLVSLLELPHPANTTVMDLLIINTALNCICRVVTNTKHHMLGKKHGITKARGC